MHVYFLYHVQHNSWLIIKGPTSKRYEETWYDAIEKIETTPNPYNSIISWIGFLEKACEDPEKGERSLCKLEPMISRSSVKTRSLKGAPPSTGYFLLGPIIVLLGPSFLGEKKIDCHLLLLELAYDIMPIRANAINFYLT